jgi:hypothetical protein
VLEARGKVTKALLTRLTTAENDGIRWAIGNACSVVAVPEDLDSVLDVLQTSRVFSAYLKGFVECLGRIGAAEPAKVRDYLVTVLADEHLQGDAIVALHRLNVCDGAEIVRATLLTDDRPRVRQAAEQYVQACDQREVDRGTKRSL